MLLQPVPYNCDIFGCYSNCLNIQKKCEIVLSKRTFNQIVEANELMNNEQLCTVELVNS